MSNQTTTDSAVMTDTAATEYEHDITFTEFELELVIRALSEYARLALGPDLPAVLQLLNDLRA